MDRPLTAWLTVNRFCNFRCKWCYAEDTKYSRRDNMSLPLATAIINLCADIGIKEVIIIGGEPTFWPHLFKTIQQIHEKGMEAVLVTNGFLFSKDRFLGKMKEAPIKGISFSLKAGTPAQYSDLVGVDAYGTITKAIESLSAAGIPFGASITLNKLIAYNLEDLIRMAMDNGASNVSMDFCTTVFEEDNPKKGYMMHPEETARVFVEKYKLMDTLTGGNLHIGQSLPMCVWPDGFLDKLITYKEETVLFRVSSNNACWNCL